MVATYKYRKRPAAKYMRYCSADLIECLFNIGGNYEYIAQISHSDLFTEVNAHFKIVGSIESRNLAHALWPKACTRAVGSSSIKRYAENTDIVFVYFMN